jgi:hypothetical protein
MLVIKHSPLPGPMRMPTGVGSPRTFYKRTHALAGARI